MMNSHIINASSTFDADVITETPFTETSIQIVRGIVETTNENKVEPYSIVELTAKYASFRERGKTINIIASSAAIISIISSVILLWMIRRSHIGLSSTYHRLLLGLCIGDIIFSSSVSCLTLWAPSELNYLVWKAMGNATTCTIQGLVFSYGFLVGAFYNCSLNLYYLALVKYEKTDEYIRKKIEPFLHGTAILIPLPVLITCLYNNNFNDHGGGACIKPVYNPPHCIGYEDGEVRDGFSIPCGRGSGLLFYYILFILTSACPPLIIGGSLFSIYRSVLRLEKKVLKYGVGSLRSNLNLSYLSRNGESTQTPNHEVDANSSTRKTSEKGICSFLRRCGRGSFEKCLVLKISKTNTTQSKSQAVLHKAIAYSISYFLTWSTMSIFFFQEFVAKKDVPVPIRCMGAIFIPLQGFYNLIIFTYPTVFAIMNKSKREKVSLRQAIVKAFWSRGTDTNICSTSRAAARRKSAECSNDRRLCSDKVMPGNNKSNTQKGRQLMFAAGIKNEREEEKTEMIPHSILDYKSAMYEQNTIINNLNAPVVENHGFLEALNGEDVELVAAHDSISSIEMKDSITASIIANEVLNDDVSNADTAIAGDRQNAENTL